MSNSSRIALYKHSGNYIGAALGGGSSQITYDVSSWEAGETHHIVLRWDSKNTLDGTNHISLSIDDDHVFNRTTGFSTEISSNLEIGTASGTTFSANALIEGLTIYRRPLFDGTNGIDVGNGDEIAQIYNSGSGQDPTLITGSWDVVFALPTNASTGSLSTGTENAWSHPHSSNLLYTDTTNTGGFMMNREMGNDGWEQEGNVGDTNSIEFDGSATEVNFGSDGSLDDLPSGGQMTVEIMSQNRNYVYDANREFVTLPE